MEFFLSLSAESTVCDGEAMVSCASCKPISLGNLYLFSISVTCTMPTMDLKRVSKDEHDYTL
jgi:hypothetical protein